MTSYFKTFSITLLLLFVSASGLIFFFQPPPLNNSTHDSTAIYDDEHHLLRLTLSHDDKYRLYTPLDQIPPVLIEATLLQEDQYFWWHPGINPVAMIKAAWETYVTHHRRVGASTITMQVARLRYGIHSKTLAGKLAQVLAAFELELHYSKKQILEAYLNRAPYGNNIEGIGAASLIYFNHDASQLSLPEAISLSIIPQNPRKRTPDYARLQDIREQLFQRWLKHHPADRDQHRLIHLPLQMRSRHDLPFIAPHFVNHVLATHTGTSQHIETTLNTHLQATLLRIMRQYIHQHKAIGVQNAAALLIDTREMSVKAAIGSADFFNPSIDGQIDGTTIPRSPGSTLKPFIYGLALDQGLIHPNTILKDTPHQFGQYNPENFDYDFMGPVKAKDALVLSRNIPAIYLQSQLKHPSFYQWLEAVQLRHLKPEQTYGLTLALGGAELSMHELSSLYAMLINDGVWRPLRLTKDALHEDGKRILSPEASFLILEILKETPPPETAIGMPQYPISWKTGTSSGFRDAWTIGSLGPYVLAVWIGHFNHQGNPAFIGKKIAAPLFFELMDAIVHEKTPLPWLTKSPAHLNLVRIPVCKASGMLPTRYCRDREETWFIPGKSPIKSDTIFREVAIDPKTGLRTCHIHKDTQFAVYEFWPTDLLSIFKQAGIQPHTPPGYMKGCHFSTNMGLDPQIRSPEPSLQYIINIHNAQYVNIPLTAVTDAEVSNIHWFINESYFTQTHPNQAVIWQAKPGKFVVRVVDDHGRSDAKEIIVRIEG